MSDFHRSGMVSSLQSILDSSQYSDVTIHCGSEEFKVHRAVICPRSKFFATACNGEYQEAKTGVIALKEDDPPTVQRMLTYFYALDYDDDDGKSGSVAYNTGDGVESACSEAKDKYPNYTRLMNNVAVYAIAHKYEVTELKELARVKFSELLFKGCLSGDPVAVVNAVFETTSFSDTGLRNVAIGFCTSQIDNIVDDDSLNGVLKDHGELGLGVIRQLLARLSDASQDLDKVAKDISIPNRDYSAESEYQLSRCKLAALQEKIKKLKQSVSAKAE